MRKKLLSLLVLLMAVVTSAWAQEKEAYAMWDEGTTTLTFMYDANKAQAYQAWNLNTGNSTPSWINTVRNSLTRVVFDASFAEVRPTTCYRWFQQCRYLTTIEGIENLNTSEVTSMNQMFYSCRQLTILDLSHFDTRNVTNMTGMFQTCNTLSRIWISNQFVTEQVTSSNNMFSNCNNLPNYNSSVRDTAGVEIYCKYKDRKYAYAMWDSETTTLTFKYDKNMPVENAWDINEGTNQPQWLNTVSSSLKNVVFDSSFAEARPTTFYYWFYNCALLESVEGVEYLKASEVTNSDYMFYRCRALTSFIIPEDLTIIGNFAFNQCSELASVNIPESVTSIGNSAFYGCSKLTSVAILESVTSIGNSAFSGCSELTSVNIPESITSIGNYVFSNCSKLTEPLYNSKLFVYMPTSTEGSYTIPNGITTIVAYAFQSCGQLTSVSIPESVTTIGNNAFANCWKLTDINIPENLTSVGGYVFRGCSSLKDPLYNSKLFVYMPPTAKGSYIVPEGITAIAAFAFDACTSLTNIILPNGLTNIGVNAFSDCKDLESITLPSSTEFIGMYAFQNCGSLADIYANPTTPPTLGGYLFGFDGSFNGTIYVPLASVDAYKTAENWSNYAENIKDNQPRVKWANGANTENWTVTAGSETITPGETIITAGTTVTVEYTGTRTVDLKAAVSMERQDNKWTFVMPELPVTLTPILGVASIDGKLYGTFSQAYYEAPNSEGTVKLEYDLVLSSNMSISKSITIDLNGYAISANGDNAHLYVYPYSKLSVIDTSENQKGGVKLKFELPTNYSNEKLNLALMGGRYVYTADEIRNNGYNGFGFIGENINSDGSPDADGYFSRLRVMTAEEKGKAAYEMKKGTFKFTLEGVGTTEMTVVKDQEIRFTPPAGWKFGDMKQEANGYNSLFRGWDGNAYITRYKTNSDNLGELVANLVPDPEKLVDQLEGITLTQSEDKTSVTLKGAGGKTVILYSENGATLMTQQVEMYKLATFKGLTTGKTYYIGINDKLIKVDTNL